MPLFDYPYQPNSQNPFERRRELLDSMVTTALELPGYKIVRNLGVVRGIVVRSRSLAGTVGASFQTIVGGDITLFTELCEKTRRDAFDRMMQHAADVGALGVVGFRYDANEIMQGVTEVLAYGTAVVVEKFEAVNKTEASEEPSAV